MAEKNWWEDAPLYTEPEEKPWTKQDLAPWENAPLESQVKTPGMAEGALRSAAEGVPVLGVLPNIAQSAVDAARAPYYKDNPEISHADTFGQRYEQNRNINTARSNAFKQENPTTAAIAGGTGAAVGAMPMFGYGAPRAAAGLGALAESAGFPRVGAALRGSPIAGNAAVGGALSGGDTALHGGSLSQSNLDAAMGAITGGLAGGIGKAAGGLTGSFIPEKNMTMEHSVFHADPSGRVHTSIIHDFDLNNWGKTIDDIKNTQGVVGVNSRPVQNPNEPWKPLNEHKVQAVGTGVGTAIGGGLHYLTGMPEFSAGGPFVGYGVSPGIGAMLSSPSTVPATTALAEGLPKFANSPQLQGILNALQHKVLGKVKD